MVRVFKNLYNINLWYGGFTLHNELHFKQRPLKIFLLKHSRGGELLRLTIAESNSCDCLKDRTTQQFSHQTDKQRNVQTVWGDVFPPKLWMSKQPHWSSAKIKNCLGMAKNPYVLFFATIPMEKWGYYIMYSALIWNEKSNWNVWLKLEETNSTLFLSRKTNDGVHWAQRTFGRNQIDWTWQLTFANQFGTWLRPLGREESLSIINRG